MQHKLKGGVFALEETSRVRWETILRKRFDLLSSKDIYNPQNLHLTASLRP